MSLGFEAEPFAAGKAMKVKRNIAVDVVDTLVARMNKRACIVRRQGHPRIRGQRYPDDDEVAFPHPQPAPVAPNRRTADELSVGQMVCIRRAWIEEVGMGRAPRAARPDYPFRSGGAARTGRSLARLQLPWRQILPRRAKVACWCSRSASGLPRDRSRAFETCRWSAEPGTVRSYHAAARFRRRGAQRRRGRAGNYRASSREPAPAARTGRFWP